MKKMLLITSLLASTSVMAGPPFAGLEGLPLLITSAPTLSPFFTTAESLNGLNKDVLAAAQEDAVKFVAAQGQGPVSDALRAAIDAINAKLVEADMKALSDNDAANMVVLVNIINAQKQ